MTEAQMPAHRLATLWQWVRAHWVGILVFGSVLILALGVRLALYDRFLPYVDYSDEVVYISLADHVRGVSDQTGLVELYGTLAPLYVTFIQGVQTLYDAVKPHDWQLTADYYYVLRLFNVAFAVCTALLLVDTGRRLAGWLAGWLAGFVWAVTPHLTMQDMLALPDTPLFFLGAVMLWATVQAWQKPSYGWLLVSLLAGIGMIYIKLWIITAVVPFLVVAGVFLWRDRLKAWRWFAGYVLVAGAGALNLFMMRDSIASNAEAVVERLWDMERIAHNFYYLFIPLGDSKFGAWHVGAVGIIAGAIAWAILAYRKQRPLMVKLDILGVLALYVLVSLPLTSFVSYVNLGYTWKIRHTLPISLVVVLLWGVAVYQVMWLVGEWLTSRHAWAKQHISASRLHAGIHIVAVVFALAPSLGWYISENQELIQRFSQTHYVSHIVNWADDNLPVEGNSLVLLPSPGGTDSLWNRYWGAYAGNRYREWWNEKIETIYDSSPTEYLERNIRYLILNSDTIAYGNTYANHTHEAFLARGAWQLIKTFAPVEGVYHGATFADPDYLVTAYVYRFGVPAITLDATWGQQLRLIGLDTNGETHSAGDAVALRLFWQRENAPTSNYSVFVHVYPADRDEVLAQVDGAPAQAQRPTLTWDDPDEVYISDLLTLILPEDLPSGDYRLAIGVYDFNTFARLTLPDGGDYITLPLVIR